MGDEIEKKMIEMMACTQCARCEELYRKALEENEQLKKDLEEEKKLNEEIKLRFVKCNTCTPEMKKNCLMFSENICEGERCTELVDIVQLVCGDNKLKEENSELKSKLDLEQAISVKGDLVIDELKDQIQKMRNCQNCKHFFDKGCFKVNYNYNDCHDYDKWELNK